MTEIRIKIEDGIPWAFACGLVADAIDELGEEERNEFIFSNPYEDTTVKFRRGKTLNFKVCKTQSKTTAS